MPAASQSCRDPAARCYAAASSPVGSGAPPAWLERRRGGRLALCVSARLEHALVAVALDLSLELVGELVDRCLVGRRGLAGDEVRPLRVHDASATWSSRIDGFCSPDNVTSTWVCSCDPARRASRAASRRTHAHRVGDVSCMSLDLEAHRALLSGSASGRRLTRNQRTARAKVIDLDAACARTSQGGCTRVGGCSRCVDVVDEADRTGDGAVCEHAAADVAPALRECEAALSGKGSPAEGRRTRERPQRRQRDASDSADAPRSHARSGSPGPGRGVDVRCGTTSAISAGGLRAPAACDHFSFHERTNVRARSSYTIADRARRMRGGGPSTPRSGAPARRPASRSARRRAGSGGRASGGRAQSAEPGRAHTAQRSGRSSSSTLHCRPLGVTALRKNAIGLRRVSAEPMSYHSPGRRQV